MKSRYKILNDNGIYFVTSTITNWTTIFINEKYFDIMINTLRFYQKNKSLVVYAYVLMHNHFHLIISNENISKIMQSVKKYTAKEIVNNLKEGWGRFNFAKTYECKTEL